MDTEHQPDPIESLEDERRLLRMIIDWVPDFLYVKDRAHRFWIVNRSLLRVFGADLQDEIFGKTDFDIFPEEYATRYQADELEVLRTGQPIVGRAERIVDREKQKEWVLTTKAPLRDEAGKIIGIIGIGRDITAQMQAEEALAVERDLVRTLMAGVPDHIYLKDLTGRFLRVNRAFAQDYGSSESDVVGGLDSDLFDAETIEKLRLDETMIAEKNAALVDLEERIVGRDGTERWFSTTKAPLRDADGKVVGIVGIARDISERRRAEERLKRSDKMASLGRLTAGIAHEMNTPLAAARAGIAELGALVSEYRAAVGDPELSVEDHFAICKEMESALSIAESALSRASAFVRGIKTQTRDLPAGDRVRFDAVRTISDGLLLLGHDLRARGCTVKFETNRDYIELVGSPGRLVQVVSNLVINAVDACVAAGRGKIEVGLTALESGAELRVTDDGTGISEANLSRIFDPMFSTKPFGEGTGLGLTIVYDIVSGEFGGAIDVSSREGHGTTFVVKFPAPAAP